MHPLVVPALLLLAAQPEVKPYGLDKRVLWDCSRVVGSPEPPPPYRVRNAFPRLKVACPIGVAHEPGSDNLLLIHQAFAWGGAGRVLRLKDDPAAEKAEVLLDLDSIIYGVAFHPDYAKNGYLFVGCNGPLKGNAKKKTRVVRYTIDRKPPFAADPRSEKVILEWESDGHNGGDLAFGPDGMLYVTSGDGTSDSDTNVVGQDLTTLLAKVLRLDVDRPDPGKAYAVPRDNPFLKTAGARPETWAYGFRNPWRIHVDRDNGDVWVGNNGQDLWEQVFLVQKGANYGWSVMEGSHPFYLDRKPGPTPFAKPIAEHHHSEARSMTGGVVYRGKALPALRGAYVYGDWSTGKVWGIRHEKGKVTWHQELASTTLQIAGFGLDSKGELLIADHGGGYYHLEANPPAPKVAKFPTRLSDTGLFTSVKDYKVHPALVPYSVNAPLWSDGADKERHLAIPGDGRIDFTGSRGWNFPDGTVAVKTFALELEEGKEASRRRIETRLLTRQQGQWVGYSYVWNDEQTDAALVERGGADRVYTIKDAKAPGGERRQTWRYPSRAECMVCHSRAANWVLGFETLQMNRAHEYGGARADQLGTFERLGLFKVGAVEHVQEARRRLSAAGAETQRILGNGLALFDGLWPTGAYQKSLDGARKAVPDLLAPLEKRLRDHPWEVALLPKRSAEYPRLVDPYDARQDLEARARSYLHANCAQCHVLAGGGNALIDLEFTAAREKMGLFGVKPQHHKLGGPDAKLVVPGDPDKSVLYQRVARRGEHQMPPLATTVVDERAVQLLHDWIKRMK